MSFVRLSTSSRERLCALVPSAIWSIVRESSSATWETRPVSSRMRSSSPFKDEFLSGRGAMFGFLRGSAAARYRCAVFVKTQDLIDVKDEDESFAKLGNGLKVFAAHARQGFGRRLD